MSFIAFDPSKACTGWAAWKRGWEKPVYGHAVLGSSYSKTGQTVTKLRAVIIDIFSTVLRFDVIFQEAPINHLMKKGTSPENVRIALGLCSTIEGVGFELGCQIFEYKPDDWRPGFCGREENQLIKREAKRAGHSATDPLKAAVREKCRQLGLIVQKHDESDAIGILTYGLLTSGIQPPWLDNEVLRPALTGAK